jgi:hypothetical protein
LSETAGSSWLLDLFFQEVLNIITITFGMANTSTKYMKAIFYDCVDFVVQKAKLEG